ncbi:MAG TPA: carboxylate-amine ligase, partial [Catalimonadaceae bacterium]|nr:carboxylate-amine ligase [Catalimonadaceae bacterium]
MPIYPILSQEEKQRMTELQEQLFDQFKWHFPDPLAPKTVVILPGLSLDPEILSKLSGVIHYEERLLCMLLLLRMPRTRIIYLSSVPIDEVIVDYYLHLIPGITGLHARNRLVLLNCNDASSRALTEKVLSRPRLIQQIKSNIPSGHVAHMVAFNVTNLEEKLAVELDIPVYGCASSLSFWGSKSGSRELFRRAGLQVPPGFENLNSLADMAEAIKKLRHEDPLLRRVVIKLNEGFSGDGNAIYDLPAHEEASVDLIRQNLDIVAKDMTVAVFEEKLQFMGG